jgi:hypothetical protein
MREEGSVCSCQDLTLGFAEADFPRFSVGGRESRRELVWRNHFLPHVTAWIGWAGTCLSSGWLDLGKAFKTLHIWLNKVQKEYAPWPSTQPQ